MGFDIAYKFSETCILPENNEETNNIFVNDPGSWFVSESCFSDGNEAFSKIELAAPIKQVDINTEDFHYDTYIFPVDKFIENNFKNSLLSAIKNITIERLHKIQFYYIFLYRF